MKRLFAILLSLVLLSACTHNSRDTTAQSPSAAPDVLVDTASEDSSQAASSVESTEPKMDVADDKKYLIDDWIVSEAIKNNQLKEVASRRVIVYLPPSYYDEPQKRYPVVYYLWSVKPYGHSAPIGVVSRMNRDLSEKMQNDGKGEFIAVETDCSSMLGASFCVNSPVTGYFDDYITQELVGYVDEKYRTIPEAEARGLAGFSSGGFGAMYLGFKHPDVFGSVLALEPMLFDPNGIKDAMDLWHETFSINYGAVFAPDTGLAYPFSAIPTFDGSEDDNQIIAKWYDGCGNWEEKIKTYLTLTEKLKAIKILVASQSSYPFIKNGCDHVQKLLKENGIPAAQEIFEGWHDIPPGFVMDHLYPFFSENLKTE